jgi:hypothetical protein
VLRSALRARAQARIVAARGPVGALPPGGAVGRGKIRPAHQSSRVRSLDMEFTAILLFTAIALWFVTEVGGESL